MSVLFTRAKLEGEEPALGAWPCVDEVRAHGNAVVFEVYNSTGENISSRTCGPAWPSVGNEMPVAAPGRGRVTQTEGTDAGTRAKQPRITGKTSPGDAAARGADGPLAKYQPFTPLRMDVANALVWKLRDSNLGADCSSKERACCSSISRATGARLVFSPLGLQRTCGPP